MGRTSKKHELHVMVVIVFGESSKEILEMTPYGCVNVHAFLLPKYRGEHHSMVDYLMGKQCRCDDDADG